MADLYSSMQLVSDGTLQTVALSFPYTSRNEIHVFVEGVEWETGWTWADSNGKVIQFDAPIPDGQHLLVRRITKLEQVPYIFGPAAGSRGYAEFSAFTVDFNFDFVLRASQDALDSFTLSGATAEAAQNWARRAEAAASAAESSENSALASASTASTQAQRAADEAADSAASAAASESHGEYAYLQAQASAASATASQNSATTAGQKATAAAGSASTAQSHATAAQQARGLAETAATTATSQATSATNSATNASTSASAASTSAGNAASSATAAQNARTGAETARNAAQAAENKAKQWADADKDVPVEPGKYSAKHWAQVAQSASDLSEYVQKSQIQQSPNDNVSGRLLEVGKSFGLGSIGALAGYDVWPSASLDDLGVPAGMYYVPTSVADRPVEDTGVIWHRQSGSAGGQTFITGDMGVFQRGRKASTYRPWMEMLRVGRFGLGAGTVAPPNGRDGVNPFGWYYQSSPVPPWGGGQFFLDMPYGTSQNAGLRLSTTPYTDDFFLNGAVSGKKEYRPACKVWHDKNFNPDSKVSVDAVKSAAYAELLGDVGTGAVMQYGSNTNGSWWRFQNGLQICILRSAVPVSTGGVVGWTLPAAFVDSQYWAEVQMHVGAGDDLTQYAARMEYLGQTASRASFVTTTPFEVIGMYIAIGRWKA